MAKKFLLGIIIFVLFMTGSYAQTVSGYIYQLENGVTVRAEQGWNFTRVSQSFIKQKEPAASGKISAVVNAIGDLISGYEVKVLKTGKELDASGLVPDAYDLKFLCRLSSVTKGTINFGVSGITVKPEMDTEVIVTLYDYQITIDDKPAGNKGLSYYETKTSRYQGNWEQNLNWSKPKFYLPGDHKKNLQPAEPMSDYHGKTKPGVYDVSIHIENTAGPEHIIWLEGLVMNPDHSYKIVTNLNAAEAAYTGGEYEVKYLRFYKLGTADKTKGTQSDRKFELFAPSANSVTPCPPGTYDVLLHYGNGKHVWRKGIVLKLGRKNEIK